MPHLGRAGPYFLSYRRLRDRLNHLLDWRLVASGIARSLAHSILALISIVFLHVYHLVPARPKSLLELHLSFCDIASSCTTNAVTNVPRLV